MLLLDAGTSLVIFTNPSTLLVNFEEVMVVRPLSAAYHIYFTV